MVYNLNYNQGTEYDKHMRHRKFLIIFVVILILIALGILVWIGFKKSPSLEEVKTSNEPVILTPSQEEQLRKDMTATGTSTLTQSETQVLIKSTSAKNSTSSTSTDSSDTLSDKQKEDLMKAMSAH